jgi:hypothetical protein
LHFENEIEYKILVTYVIAKVSKCVFNCALFKGNENVKVSDQSQSSLHFRNGVQAALGIL